MRLGELVAIVAAHPPRVRVGQRQDRELDDAGAIDETIEDPELERMDDILGVVQHDRLRRMAALKLVSD